MKKHPARTSTRHAWRRAPQYLMLLAAACLSAQTEADYLRANSLRQKMQGLALNMTGPMNWIGATDRFWYRKSVAGGNVFIVMNAATLQKSAAFDHDKLAAALGEKYTGLTLPFTEFTFVDEHAMQFVAAGRTGIAI